MSVDLWLLFSFDEKNIQLSMQQKEKENEFLVNTNDELKYEYIALVIIIETLRLMNF